MSAPLRARRRYRKVAINVLRPDLAFQGVALDAVIRAHAPLPVPIVRELLLQVCAVLQHSHDQGVLHGDLKPATILIDDLGSVHVNRLGLASSAESSADYMSPEQCLGQTTSFASDQYSVGLIVYELLTGFPPFTGQPLEVQWAQLHEPPAWVSFARRDCPAPLAAAVMRMLAKEPNERWPALRNAMSRIASAPRMDPTCGRTPLSQLVRDMQLTPPPIVRPLPVSALEIPPRPSAIDPGQAGSPTPTPPPAREPRASRWPRRFAVGAWVAVAILALGWIEAFVLARRPNGPSVSIAPATAAAPKTK